MDSDVGRKRIDIDLAEIERLAGLGLSEEEICLAIGISRTTLHNRKRESEQVEQAIKKGRSRAAGEVANALYQQALSGNTTAIVWYEKTRRGITEHQELIKRIEELEARANGNADQETNRNT